MAAKYRFLVLIVLSQITSACSTAPELEPASLMEASSEPALFNSSSGDFCSQSTSIGPHNCREQTHTITPDSPTTTNSAYLQSIAYEVRFGFEFRCGNVNPPIVTLSRPGSSEAIDIGHRSTPHTGVLGPFAVPYSGSSFELKIKPRNAGMMSSNCTVKLVSKLTTPFIKSLRWYRDELQGRAHELVEIKSAVSQATELPAKWAAIKELPGTFQTQIDQALMEKDFLGQEFSQLREAKDQRELSEDEMSRFLELDGDGGLIAVEAAEEALFSGLKTDVEQVLSVARPCYENGGNASQSDCLAAATEVEEKVQSGVKSQKDLLEELKLFVEREKARIQSFDAALAARLQQIVSSIN